jgi:hypothetical protein
MSSIFEDLACVQYAAISFPLKKVGREKNVRGLSITWVQYVPLTFDGARAASSTHHGSHPRLSSATDVRHDGSIVRARVRSDCPCLRVCLAAVGRGRRGCWPHLALIGESAEDAGLAGCTHKVFVARVVRP